MKRAVMSAVAAGAGFVAGHLLPAAAFLLVYFAGPAIREDRHVARDNTLMMLYLVCVYALAGAVAYALIASISRAWRERGLKQQFFVSLLAGVAAQLLSWTGLALVALLPLLHVLPRNVTTVLAIAMPGALCGIAVLAWSLVRAAQSAREQNTPERNTKADGAG